MLAALRLHLRQVLAGKRLLLLGICLCAPLFIVTMIRANVVFDSDIEFRIVSSITLFGFYAIGVPALASLMYGTSIIGAEVQNQTLTYLFTRPISRWRIVTGKYLANVLVVTAGTLISLVIAWSILGATLETLQAVAVAMVASVVAYNAVFAMIGALFTRRSLVAGIIYIGVSEGLLPQLPTFIRNFTTHFHARTIAFDLSGLSGELPREFRSEVRMLVGDHSIGSALLAIAAIAGVTLAITCWRTTTREFALTDDP